MSPFNSDYVHWYGQLEPRKAREFDTGIARNVSYYNTVVMALLVVMRGFSAREREIESPTMG